MFYCSGFILQENWLITSERIYVILTSQVILCGLGFKNYIYWEQRIMGVKPKRQGERVYLNSCMVVLLINRLGK